MVATPDETCTVVGRTFYLKPILECVAAAAPPPTLDSATLAIFVTALAVAATLATRIGALSAALLGGAGSLGVLYFYQPDVYNTYVWPPSRESAPALTIVAAAFAALAAHSFAAVRTSEDAERVKQDKRKLVAAQLTQAMRWDEDEDEDKDKEGDDKAEEAEAEEGATEEEKKAKAEEAAKAKAEAKAKEEAKAKADAKADAKAEAVADAPDDSRFVRLA